jgi:hypothetical protein
MVANLSASGAAWALLAVNVIAIVGQQIVGRYFMVRIRIKHADILGHVAGITGVINAVLFAFIVFVAWTYYDRARDTVDHEVALVWQIWQDVETAEPGSGHPMDKVMPEVHEEIVHQMLCYVDEVAFHEWDAMQSYSDSRQTSEYRQKFDHGTQMLRTAYEDVLRAHAKSATSKVLVGEMVKRFNTLFEVRRQRIALSSEGAIPSVVWLALIGGGLLCITCCWFIGFADLKLHAVIMALIASSFGLILFLITSLNMPFSGSAAISTERFVTLRSDIRQWEKSEADEAPGPSP